MANLSGDWMTASEFVGTLEITQEDPMDRVELLLKLEALLFQNEEIDPVEIYLSALEQELL